ncbi:MAG: hemerythrin domain-containing protein [Kineosporiaceae bacterium]
MSTLPPTPGTPFGDTTGSTTGYDDDLPVISSTDPVADATAAGERDVVDVLTEDHAEMLALIATIRTEDDPQVRRDIADIVITEIVRHAVAEEMHVYPAVREHVADGDAAVQHDIEEHKEIERTLKDLEGTEPTDPRFEELVANLEATLRDHAADEELEQFPQLRAAIPREELVAIAGKVETAKKMAPTRPHPAAPNNKLFHQLVGPGVGLVDRLHDKLTGKATA